MSDMNLKHIIVAKVDNVPGVVSRMSGFFTRRGYNIESLVTSMTDDPTVYHLTISVLCSREEATLLLHQLGRLIEVIDVIETTGTDVITRELMFVKINAPKEKRPEIMQICDILKIKIVGMSDIAATIEVTGDAQKLDGILASLEHFGITETVRSGAICVVK